MGVSRQQTPPRGVGDQFGGVDAQILYETVAVVVGGLDADAEEAGDLFGGPPVDDETEDLRSRPPAMP